VDQAASTYPAASTDGPDGDPATDPAAKSTDAADGATVGVGSSTGATGSKGKDSAGAAVLTTDSDWTGDKWGSGAFIRAAG
jgi:hypothetical protein